MDNLKESLKQLNFHKKLDFEPRDFTVKYAARKYGDFCLSRIPSQYRVAMATNGVVLLLSALFCFLKLFILPVGEYNPYEVLLTYIPTIIACGILKMLLYANRNNTKKHMVLVQNLIYISMLHVAYWGLVVIIISKFYNHEIFYFTWIIGIVIYSSGIAIIPPFSMISLTIFFICCSIIFKVFDITLGNGVGPNMFILCIITYALVIIRFYHEYNEFKISNALQRASEDAIQLREEAEHANLAKSRFLAHMSHEIRTPINAILGTDEMILREAHEDTILDYADDIKGSGNMLLALVNDILDMSKIEAGKLSIVPEYYSLAQIVDELKTMIVFRTRARGLNFFTHIDRDIPDRLFGDSVRVKQVITNILTNAVKYTHEGSVSFMVEYKRPKSEPDKIELIVTVEDTGIGMRKEDLAHLADRFTRFDEKKNKNIEGTGLGMSITYSLLELMGGALDVASVYNEGSTFILKIPQGFEEGDTVGNVMDIMNKKRKAQIDTGGKYKPLFTAKEARILIVDDNAVNLKVAVGLLKKTKLIIDTADSGLKCLEKINENYYDIIFLDHMMPNMDGVDTLKEIKRRKHKCKGVPVIAMTANVGSQIAEEYISLGFDDYISKPIEPRVYEELILKYLPKEKYTINS